jgi:predicted pyridoxine 5'-phosphate oxidase superfamily flavin-nucleotide-binding protein
MPDAIISSDVAFTATVKAEQQRRGSRAGYARMEARGGWATEDSAYLATANAKGQPYAQHRGGPKGFLCVIDNRTIGFADYTGNRQYITTGNLGENDQAFLFLMDYAHRRRVKLWGRAVVTDDPAIVARLMPDGYNAKPEQAILFEITAWDSNCSQHIPQKISATDIAETINRLEIRLKAAEAENAELRAWLGRRSEA